MKKAIVLAENNIIKRISALFFNVYSYMSLRAGRAWQSFLLRLLLPKQVRDRNDVSSNSLELVGTG
jgi:hypothetical protein